MRTRRRQAAALVGAILVGTAFLFTSAPLHAVENDLLPIGSAAPAFEAIDIEGKTFTLAEAIKEKPVLLVFWSLFCGTCREELPILEQEQPKYPQIQIVTVNLDEAPRAKTVKGFTKQQGFTYRMLLNKIEGKEFNVDSAFKIKATPALYLVNTDGLVAYGHYGAVSPEELAEILAKAK